jgi:signal transduction histidine kinase
MPEMFMQESATTTTQIKHRLNRVIEIMKDGLLTLDEHNIILTANDAAVRDILGVSSPDDIRGNKMTDLFTGDDASETIAASFSLHQDFRDKRIHYIHPSGQTRILLCSVVHTKDEDSKTLTKFVLLHDLTREESVSEKLSEYTRKLEKKNNELDQFAYIVSHDLKAPLRAISNLAGWLEEDLGPSLTGDNRNNLQLLRNRVVRMESLINGVLEYSKIGRTQVEQEPVDVYTLLKEVEEMLAPPAHISIQIIEPIPTVTAPRTMLLQVFANLISNAIKYNDKAEGLVKVYCTCNDQYYQFTVEDNGPGIPRESHESIFVIFHTLQSRDKFESTGIGLTIVKRILEENGGRIWVDSEPNNGSKFIFLWPRQNQQLK